MLYQRLQWKNNLPYSETYGDVYFSESGGGDESRHVFIDGNKLASRFSQCDSEQSQTFTICETGFGTGLNFFLTVLCFLQCAKPDATLDYVSIEKHLLHPEDLRKVYENQPDLITLCDELLGNYPATVNGIHRCYMCSLEHSFCSGFIEPI